MYLHVEKINCNFVVLTATPTTKIPDLKKKYLTNIVIHNKNKSSKINLKKISNINT